MSSDKAAAGMSTKRKVTREVRGRDRQKIREASKELAEDGGE